jgi:HME family heavy-metal exporter
MLSGVQAQVAIKLYGDDLATLRRTAKEMKGDIADVPGVTDLQVEQQVEIPQLQIQTRPRLLARNGMTSTTSTSSSKRR